jgi:hypothetical protein
VFFSANCTSLTGVGNGTAPAAFITNSDLRNAVTDWVSENGADRLNVRCKYGHITYWDVSQLTDFTEVFKAKATFNEPLMWNTASAITMHKMFKDAEAFNQPLLWNTSELVSLHTTFQNAIAFNSSLPWNTAKLETLHRTFDH